MLTKLIIKNIRITGAKLLPFLIGYLILLDGLFIRKFYDWDVYMMSGYLIISYVASLIYFIEKKTSAEIFSVSLPVTRSMIVTSRYVTSLLIILFGFTIWFLSAYFWDLILDDGITLFYDITYIKVGFMAALFVTIHQSVFLPFSCKFKVIGIGIAFVFATVISVALIMNIFAPYKRSYNSYFVESEMGLIILFSAAIVFLPIISIFLSYKLYNRHDL